MKRLFLALLPLLISAPAFAQSAAPGSQTVTLTLASVNQPLYPAWYWIIYLTMLAVAVFMIGVVVTALRRRG
ncbi:MAG TPA: hypothetical protein VL418_11305 [Devosiaceae bacterium]|nr:hypothetical protein [Devosiaceae bacterium]